MKLRKLIVRDLGPYRQTRQFDFSPDLTVVVGANYAGKSTLVRALYFALSGRVLTPGLKAGMLVSSAAASGTVGVHYQYREAEYRLFRSTTGNVQVERAHGDKWQRCAAEEDEVLPALNPQQWQVGCFLHEDELGQFLLQPPASRRDLLNQLLGVERLLNAQEAFIQVRRLAKRQEKTAVSMRDNLRVGEHNDHTAELQAVQQAVVTLDARLQALSAAAGGEADERLRQSWQQAKAAAQSRRDRAQDELQAIRAGFAHREELAALLAQSAEQLARLETAQHEVERRTEQRILLASQVQQRDDLLSTLQGLQGAEHCPTCQQPLTEKVLTTLVSDYCAQRDQLLSEFERAQTQEHEAREQLRLLEELALKHADLEQRLARWQQLDGEIAAALTEAGEWESKLAALQPLSAEAASREQLQAELEQQRRRLLELEQQQSTFERQREEMQAANRRAEAATRHRLLSECAAEAVAATVRATLGIPLRQAEAEIAEALQQFELFGARSQAIDLEKSQLMPAIEGRVLTSLSGSEKTLLYLSMKIALSRLLPGADFLVLDEPTTHLDKVRQARLRDYLLKLAPAKQLILFTNNREFAAQFENAAHLEL